MTTNQPVNDAVYTLESYDIDFIKLVDGKVIKAHITQNGVTESDEIQKQYDSEYDAILDLCGTVIPPSFYPYLEKMMGRRVSWDIINNVIFLNQPNGRWNERLGRYLHARELGMEAVDDYELALVEAVQESIIALRHFVV